MFKVGLNWSRSTVSPDGAFVASGSQDGNVFIWNSQNGVLEKMLKGNMYDYSLILDLLCVELFGLH